MKPNVKANNRLLLIIAATGLLTSGTLYADAYYVSGQNGNDSWSGLLSAPNASFTDGPLQTLSAAQARMRGSSTKSVFVRAGTYSIASGMQFDFTDNGEQWAAYPGENVTLDGGNAGDFIMIGVSNLGFDGFNFQNTGTLGLSIFTVDNLSVTRNTFFNCKQSCVGGATLTNSTIYANIMNGQSDILGLTIGLFGGSSNNRITHNLIENAHGGGIGFAVNQFDAPPSHNIIDRNILQNVCTTSFDSGAIYFFDRSHLGTGNQITNNLIKNVGNGTGINTNQNKAFYIDDLASGILVSGNICKDCGKWAWVIHGGDHNTFVNNIFDISADGNPLGLYQTLASEQNLHDFGMTENVFQRNIIYISGPVPTDLYQVNLVSSDALPPTSHNLWWAASGAQVPNGNDIVDSSPVYANPQFANEPGGDFSMPPSSPAFTMIGFQPLVTDQGPPPGLTPPPALRFIPVQPCRVADTRNPPGPYGAPAIPALGTRNFTIPGTCGIPASAQAFSVNLTVVPTQSLGFVSMWPTGQPQPLVSTLNSLDGRVKSNAAIVPAGAGGAVSVFATDRTDAILDINGYFVSASDSSSLAFFPLAPCRVADTRNGAGALGGPSLVGTQARSFPVLSSACNIPGNARAYSLNFTAVPQGPLGFLSVWPTGQNQPLVSTLNALTGAVTANAAIVPAGNSGAINLYATDNADVVIDINGYFAPPGSGGYSLYNLTPCRIKDTRLPPGSPAFSGTIAVTATGVPCSVPNQAQALVLNATVVPSGVLGFLTLWPFGGSQPFVSTLNSLDATITSNLALVPSTVGFVDAFASGPGATHLILDISGYFAP